MWARLNEAYDYFENDESLYKKIVDPSVVTRLLEKHTNDLAKIERFILNNCNVFLLINFSKHENGWSCLRTCFENATTEQQQAMIGDIVSSDLAHRRDWGPAEIYTEKWYRNNICNELIQVLVKIFEEEKEGSKLLLAFKENKPLYDYIQRYKRNAKTHQNEKIHCRALIPLCNYSGGSKEYITYCSSKKLYQHFGPVPYSQWVSVSPPMPRQGVHTHFQETINLNALKKTVQSYPWMALDVLDPRTIKLFQENDEAFSILIDSCNMNFELYRKQTHADYFSRVLTDLYNVVRYRHKEIIGKNDVQEQLQLLLKIFKILFEKRIHTTGFNNIFIALVNEFTLNNSKLLSKIEEIILPTILVFLAGQTNLTKDQFQLLITQATKNEGDIKQLLIAVEGLQLSAAKFSKHVTFYENWIDGLLKRLSVLICDKAMSEQANDILKNLDLSKLNDRSKNVLSTALGNKLNLTVTKLIENSRSKNKSQQEEKQNPQSEECLMKIEEKQDPQEECLMKIIDWYANNFDQSAGKQLKFFLETKAETFKVAKHYFSIIKNKNSSDELLITVKTQLTHMLFVGEVIFDFIGTSDEVELNDCNASEESALKRYMQAYEFIFDLAEKEPLLYKKIIHKLNKSNSMNANTTPKLEMPPDVEKAFSNYYIRKFSNANNGTPISSITQIYRQYFSRVEQKLEQFKTLVASIDTSQHSSLSILVEQFQTILGTNQTTSLTVPAQLYPILTAVTKPVKLDSEQEEEKTPPKLDPVVLTTTTTDASASEQELKEETIESPAQNPLLIKSINSLMEEICNLSKPLTNKSEPPTSQPVVEEESEELDETKVQGLLCG